MWGYEVKVYVKQRGLDGLRMEYWREVTKCEAKPLYGPDYCEKEGVTCDSLECQKAVGRRDRAGILKFCHW